MKKLKNLCLAIFSFLFLFSSCVIRQKEETQTNIRSITVNGSGNVSIKPDTVSLKFIVRTTDWNVAKATSLNATNTQNAITAIKDAGVDSLDISTCDFTISQDNSKEYPGQYTVKNTILVVVRNIENAGKVIDGAVKNNTGANGITSFQYSVSDKETALRQARTLAIQDAYDAANLLASASGCKVSEVIEIREDYTSVTSQNNNSMFKTVMLEDSAMGRTTIESGNMTVSSNVTIKYSLEN